MTKMIKMSLIAAVAVTGITSTVSAQPLEEAIKGVDVSGMLRYRWEETSTDTKKATTTNAHSAINNFRLDINAKSKVNDVVTANVTVGISDTTATDPADVSTAANGEDVNPVLVVRNANFSAAVAGATVIAGKQSIPGPFVDNWSDDVTRGTGVVALIPAGPVTIAAGHFVNHNANFSTSVGLDATVNSYLDTKNATELAVLGTVAGVSFDAWYANVTDAVDGLSIGAKATVAGIALDLRHSSLDVTDIYRKTAASATQDGESTLTKLVASTKVAGATVVAGLATTGKHNGVLYNSMSIDRDNDAQSDFKVYQASVGQFADATAMLIGASMPVMDAVTAEAKYVTVSAKDGDTAAAKDLDASELYFGATYAMSKNFSVHARYSMLEIDRVAGHASGDVDATKGRLELKYSF